MAKSKKSSLKGRLKANALTAKDIKQIAKIVKDVESAAKKLRAAVVE